MPSPIRCPSLRGATSVLMFGTVVLYAAIVHAACGCFGCLNGASCRLQAVSPDDDWDVPQDEDAVPSAEFRIRNRWTRTANNPFNSRNQGTPTTITWGIVDDGTTISGSEGTSGSDLIAMLNGQYGANPSDPIEGAPWFRFFEASFDRWSELSGVSYLYEPNDGGAAINNTTTPAGRVGVYPDVRIGGHSIDGASGSNTLGYNYFPSHADMVIDTDNAAFYGNRFGDSRRLRNVLMHEAGHGLGFSHLESSDSRQLLEPFISTAFDGPQIDDILAVQRNYGDPLEKNGGNDSPISPTEIGEFGDDAEWVVGADGRARIVSRSQTDFVSIDGSSDRDYYRFTVTTPGVLDVTLTQVGHTYSEGPQDGTQTPLNTATLNPLELRLLSSADTGGLVTEAQGSPIGTLGQGVVMQSLVPGCDYFVFVSGTVNNVQLYELSLGFTAVPIPEPMSLAAAALAACVGFVGTRRTG